MVMVPKGPSVQQVQRAAERDWSWGGVPLPAWLEPRDYQLEAVDRIAKEFERGTRVVMLDAPTGTGKTAIAELERRVQEVAKGLYVCTTKSLQDQVARDFEYAKVLKGRRNYLPGGDSGVDDMRFMAGRGGAGSEVTCQDCDRGPVGVPREEQSCSWCPLVEECPYLVAHDETVTAPVGILNTSYLLSTCNHVRESPFAGRELVVMDEADLIEGELLGFVELTIGKGMARELGVEVPKKGSHMTTIRAWMQEELEPAIKVRVKGLGRGLEASRKRRSLDRLAQGVHRVVNREEGWVREAGEDEKDGGLTLKPVSVEDVGDKYLWRHAEKWLLMSGTTVSPEMQAEALGLEEADIPWSVVEVPMQFDKANRRVVYVPAGSMTRKGQEAGGAKKVMRALERLVVEKEPEGNMLIHTFSYQLAKETVEFLQGVREEVRPVITYTNARDREGALERFKKAADKGGAILVASSMDRGIDLPGDLCRVQVVMKMPMASLGSRQVSERLHQPGGDAWYLMNNIRTLLQQCGRAVRGRDDWAVTYILDEHFGKVLKDGKRMGMFPQWWLDALEVGKLREFV